MDWKVILTAFSSVFLAEIGDKTQLAAFALSGGGSSKWNVFIGASLALVVSTAIAVLAGGWVEKHVPIVWVKRGAGALFLVLGILLLITSEGAAASAGNEDAEGNAGKVEQSE